MAAGVEKVRGWLERAAAIGSPWLRVASGFYRADLAGDADKIDGERAYVTEVLAGAADEAAASGIQLLLENHSDFTVEEFARIVRDTTSLASQ